MSKSGWDVPAERLEARLADKKPLYTEHEAITEANRCLYCSDAPCIAACPTEINIPTFIHKIATGNVKGAARTIFESNLLGYSCARVCPVEVLCAGECVYNEWERAPIEIGRLQRFATETAIERDPALVAKQRKPKTGKRIACIGSGPASLAAAGHLALDGHAVVIFERKPLPGGLNTLGIAPYKMQATDAVDEVNFILGLGDIEVRTGITVVEGDAKGAGEVSAAALLRDHDAVFVGVGLGSDSALRVDGEAGPGVYGATALIERLKVDPTMTLEGVKHALVIGGGNTAIDIARELAQLCVDEVTMVYRREAERMTGYEHELDGARRDGVRLLECRQPVRFERDGSGKLTGVVLARTEGGKPVAGTEERIPCDLAALAIGQARLTSLAKVFPGVSLESDGRVQVDERTCRTGNPKVYAGGDCVNGGKEVVNAAQHGKLAARAITASFA